MSTPIRRRSYEILRDLKDVVGIGKVADAAHISAPMAYKWTEPSAYDEDLFAEPSGRPNPIDKVGELLHLMVAENQHDLALETINWLARECGGIFIGSDQMEAIDALFNKVKGQGLPRPVRTGGAAGRTGVKSNGNEGQ